MLQIIVSALFILTLQRLDSFTGAYQGTLRNVSGVGQMGSADAVTTTFSLQLRGDSLLLEGVSRSGSLVTLGAWPKNRIRVDGDVLTVKGIARGSLRHRRTMTWKASAGIKAQVEILTLGASASEDDYFGGKKMMLTLLKVR